jgi:DNA repair protein RecO (recombination protein O)
MSVRPARLRTRFEDTALVLRRFSYGESSLVVHLLTPAYGRVSALAKVAYRPSSGFFGVLDLFDTLRVRWTRGDARGLALVTGAAIVARRRELTTDMGRYRAATAVLELAHVAAREEHEEGALFHAAQEALDQIARARVDPGLARNSFDHAFLRLAGLSPALESCASCGGKQAGRADPVPFAPLLGGRLCAACARAARSHGRTIGSLPLNVVRVASSLMHSPPSMLEKIRIDRGVQERVRVFVERFLETHLETRLRSRGNGAGRIARRVR